MFVGWLGAFTMVEEKQKNKKGKKGKEKNKRKTQGKRENQ